MSDLKRLSERGHAFVGALVRNPRDAMSYLGESLVALRDHPSDLSVDESWEEHLHEFLGAPWPCPEVSVVEAIWTAIPAELESRGLQFGRQTYGGYSDGDLAFVRAAWCAVSHLRAAVVVETGVARGVTSRIVLEALARSEHGHLWSIDQPHLLEANLHAQTGAAVPHALSSRWTYIEGSSRRQLPAVLRSLNGRVDVFLHDSLHTSRNTRYEMGQVYPALSTGGLMIVDDISTHQGFSTFANSVRGNRTLVCRSADGLGLFGILHKDN
jgi:hypothetical protein